MILSSGLKLISILLLSIALTTLLFLIDSSTFEVISNAYGQNNNIITYYDPTGTYSINYPSDWSVWYNAGQSFFMDPYSMAVVQVGVLGPVNPSLSPKQILDIYSTVKVQDTFPPISIKSSKYTFVGNNGAGMQLVYTYMNPNRQFVYAESEILTNGIYVYDIESLAPIEFYKTFVPIMSQMRKSIDYKQVSSSTSDIKGKSEIEKLKYCTMMNTIQGIHIDPMYKFYDPYCDTWHR
jgi:hypothetical protein